MRELDSHEAKICFKLYREGCFGSHWLLKDTAASGFPSHELDQVKDAIDDLVRDGILRLKSTQYGERRLHQPQAEGRCLPAHHRAL